MKIAHLLRIAQIIGMLRNCLRGILIIVVTKCGNKETSLRF